MIYLLFVISPFLALISALKSFYDQNSRIILWLFISYFAYSIDIISLGTGPDIVRDFNEFNNCARSSSATLSFSNYVFEQNNNFDFLLNAIVYLVSRITTNGHFFLLILGLIYGYFYSGNMFMIYNIINDKSAFIVCCLFMLCMIIGIQEINGFRFWTSSHIFIYFILKYFQNNSVLKILLAVLCISMLHFSMAILYAPLLVFFILPNKHIKFYFISFVIIKSTINIFESEIAKLVEIVLPKNNADLSERVMGYTSSEYKDALKKAISTNNFYLDWNLFILRNISNILFFISGYLYLWKSKVEGDNIEKLFKFILVLGIFSSVMATQTSGGRFIIIFQFFSFYFGIYYFRYSGLYLKIPRLILNLFYILFVVVLIVNIRLLSEFFGLTALFGNFFIKSISNDDYRLIDFMKIFIPALD